MSLFIKAWNHLPLCTEGNWTPQQIWVNGMISQDNAENTLVKDIIEEDGQVADSYGEDPQIVRQPQGDVTKCCLVRVNDNSENLFLFNFFSHA